MSDTIVRVSDSITTVEVVGIAAVTAQRILAENAVANATVEANRATSQSAAAALAASNAETARASAIATSNVFATTAAGEAATVTDELFTVPANGFYRFYKRTAVGSTELLPPLPLGKISAPTGDPNSPVQFTRALELESGAGPWDKTLILRQKQGALSALDIHTGQTGAAMRMFRPDGVLQSYFNDGKAFITAAWVGIHAGIYDQIGEPGEPGYNRIYHPPNQVPQVLGVHSDTRLAAVIRGNLSPDPQALLIMDADARGRRLDMCDGSIRWPRPDVLPLVGDVRTAAPNVAQIDIPIGEYPIVQQTFNAGGRYGMITKSEDLATIGSAWNFMQQNGGIAAQNGNQLFQNDSGVVLRIGNAVTHNITINAPVQTQFEILGANVASVTSSGFSPMTDATKDLGDAGLRWNNLYLANNPIIGSDRRLKQDIEEIPEAWMRAWSNVKPKRFRYKASVREKGKKEARFHVGYIAQDIIAAFDAEGVDAAELGLVCLQKWDDQFVDEIVDVEIPEEIVSETKVVDAGGGLVDVKGRPMTKEITEERTVPAYTERQATGRKTKVRDAGEYWAVRYEQCAVFEHAMRGLS